MVKLDMKKVEEFITGLEGYSVNEIIENVKALQVVIYTMCGGGFLGKFANCGIF